MLDYGFGILDIFKWINGQEQNFEESVKTTLSRNAEVTSNSFQSVLILE